MGVHTRAKKSANLSVKLQALFASLAFVWRAIKLRNQSDVYLDHIKGCLDQKVVGSSSAVVIKINLATIAVFWLSR